MSGSTQHDLQRLFALDTCALSDALDSLSLPGALSGIRECAGRQRIAGTATTVQLKPGQAPPHQPKVHLGATAIDSAGPGNIIVIEHPGIDAGGWGGVLSQAAVLKGIEGIVLGGFCRDIDEANTLNFPVFAMGSTTRTARGRLFEAATNIDVNLAGVIISPGDFVLADATGVVVVAAKNIQEVLTKAEAIATREAVMVTALKQGKNVVDVLGADYENMLK